MPSSVVWVGWEDITPLRAKTALHCSSTHPWPGRPQPSSIPGPSFLLTSEPVSPPSACDASRCFSGSSGAALWAVVEGMERWRDAQWGLGILGRSHCCVAHVPHLLGEPSAALRRGCSDLRAVKIGPEIRSVTCPQVLLNQLLRRGVGMREAAQWVCRMKSEALCLVYGSSIPSTTSPVLCNLHCRSIQALSSSPTHYCCFYPWHIRWFSNLHFPKQIPELPCPCVRPTSVSPFSKAQAQGL